MSQSMHSTTWCCKFEFREHSFTRAKLVAIALLCANTACSGDGDGRDTPAQGSTGLSGTIVTTSFDTGTYGVFYEIDAASGTASIAGFAREDRDDESQYNTLADFMFGRPHAGQQPIVGIAHCIPEEPGDPFETRRISCIEAIDESGQFNRLFTLDRELVDRPSQSPDGSLIAVVTTSPHNDFVNGTQSIELLSRSGDLLDTRLIDRNLDSAPYILEWTPDNRLVYAIRVEGFETRIRMTEPLSLENAASFLISEDGSPNIRTLAVSPDGMSIAYDLFLPDNESAARTYVLDVASGATRLLAQSAENRLIATPEWSPDGSQIMVTSADFEFFSTLFGTGLPFKIVLPANSDSPPFIDGAAGVGTLLDTQEVVGDFGDGGFETDFDNRSDFWLFENHVFWIE